MDKANGRIDLVNTVRIPENREGVTTLQFYNTDPVFPTPGNLCQFTDRIHGLEAEIKSAMIF
jgi:hypothetical protein